MSKKIKCIFGLQNKFKYIASNALEIFPENYSEYDYIDPYCETGIVFFNKDKSKNIEVINNQNSNVSDFFYALRDEPDFFINKIKKTNLKKYISPNLENDHDYVDVALDYFVSKIKNEHKNNLEKKWKEIKVELKNFKERIEKCFISNTDPLSIIQSFNNKNSLCFCCPPFDSDKVINPEMTTDNHIDLNYTLSKFKGKIIIVGSSTALYKRLYKEWNGIKINDKKNEYIWCNY